MRCGHRFPGPELIQDGDWRPLTRRMPNGESCPRERGDSKMFERSGHRQPAPNCQAHWYFFFKKNNLYLFIYLLAVQHVGILVPWTGIEPVPSAVAYDIITHWTTKEVPRISISCSGQVLGRPRVRWPEDDIKQSSPLVTFVTVRKHPSPMTPFLK